MRITPIVSYSRLCQISHKAAAPKSQNFPTEYELQEFMRKGNYFNPADIYKETGETYLQEIINRDYSMLILHMRSKNYDVREALNIRNKDGKLPIESVQSEEMQIALTNLIDSQKQKNTTEDARVTAAKTYMEEPVNQKIAKGKDEDKPKIDYFNMFKEIDDEEAPAKTTEEKISQQENTNNMPISCNVNQCQVMEIDKEGLEDFKILEINPGDILTIDDLIGREEIKKELKVNVIAPLKDSSVAQKLKENNVDLPNGILFAAEGGGELTIIKALSNESGIPAIILENPQDLNAALIAIESRYKTKGLKTIILAQGFDKYFSNCTTCDNTNANRFRNKIRGVKEKGGLFIATATDKKQVRPEFMQSGILDKIFTVEKPNESDRTEFLKRHFQDKEIYQDVNNDETIAKMVMLTDNRSYADIMRLLDETARTATAYSKKVDLETFEKQLEDFSKELDIVPITEENRTAGYDQNIHRIPISEGEMMNLDELGGAFDIKKFLRDRYVEPYREYEKLKDKPIKNKLPDGAIFYGDPGNGKSTVARVLARELGLPYYEITMSDIGKHSLVGEAERDLDAMIQDLITKFEKTGERSVLFLDEFDSLGTARDNNQSNYHKNITDKLLQLLNKPSQKGLIVIAATNDLLAVDEALRRRDRLGNWVEFKNPNQEEREDTIKKILIKDEELKSFAEDDKWVTKNAKELDGLAMSSIVMVLDDASRDYYLHGTDFDASITKAIDVEVKRLLGELTGKAGLKQFKYEEWNYKSLDELGGMSEVIRQLREYVIDAWDPEIRKALIANKRMPSGGFILEGPPGGGKTTVIETLAREMDVPLYKMDYNQEGNEYIHQVAKHVHEIFDRLALQAKILKKPVMLFFDEAEKFFPQNAERHQIEEVNTYKELMNTASAKGIILAGATNYIERVNHEITGNPRRMGTIIHCGNPNLEDRKDILRKLFTDLPILTNDTDDIVEGDKDGEGPHCLDEKSIAEIAIVTKDFSIGEISDAVDKIISHAVKRKENLTPKAVVKEFIDNISVQHLKKMSIKGQLK